MMWCHTIVGVAILLASALRADAAELSHIERVIAKEPAHQSAAPEYALLVFGVEAQTRVWIMVDGDVVYIDRKANGDLTDPADRVRFPAFQPDRANLSVESRSVRLSDLADGRLRHRNLTLVQHRIRPGFKPRTDAEKPPQAIVARGSATFYEVSVEVEFHPLPGARMDLVGRMRQSAGGDAPDYLCFAARPADAPIIHFGGLLHMAAFPGQQLNRGDASTSVGAVIGTPGLGDGTFATVGHGGLFSDTVHPVAQITFPNNAAGQKPITVQVPLDQRC